LSDWRRTLRELGGHDELPVGLLDRVDRLEERPLEIALTDVPVVAGDDDVAAADVPAEILEEGLGEGERQGAAVAGIDRLEAGVGHVPIAREGDGKGSAEGDGLLERPAVVPVVRGHLVGRVDPGVRGRVLVLLPEIESQGRKELLPAPREGQVGELGGIDLDGDAEVALDRPGDALAEGEGDRLLLLRG
jgi:hypothetical protein